MSRILRDRKDKMIQNSSTKNLQPHGADRGNARVINRRLILNYIRKYGPLPRVTIAKELHLSRPTVSSVIDKLLSEEWVKEGNERDATEKGGRRAINVYFNANAGYVIGVDVGRRHLRMLLTDLEGNSIQTYQNTFDTSQGGKTCLRLLAKELHTFMKDNGIALENILGIGIGIPGTLDPSSKMLILAPHMPEWDGIDIPKSLEDSFKKTPFYIDNDANMGALGESRYGVGKGIRNQIYIKVGTGIGAGLILDGEIYRGRRHTAGEFGHVIIDKDGPPCGNHKGCLEVIAAAPAIVKDAYQRELLLTLPLKGSQHAEIRTPINSQSYTEYETITTAFIKVAELAKSGDEVCKAAIVNAGKQVGIAAVNLVNLLNPEMIILDGGVVRNAKELFIDPLKESVKAYSLPAAWEGTCIKAGELEDKAIVFGAVATVIDTAFGTLNSEKSSW